MNTRSNTLLMPPRGWRSLAAIAMAICCGLLGAGTLRAQTFDDIYGATSGNSNWEAGYNRVLPVTGNCKTTHQIDGNCSQGGVDSNGYIAVGYTTTPSSGAGADVYIVRINNYGGKIWERVYNIGGGNSHDTAWAVVETNDAFYITGTTEQNVQGGGTQLDIFLLKVDCQGQFGFVQIYGTAGDEHGRDLIIAQQGNNSTTHAGDLVMTGWKDNATSGTADGILMRVNSTGTLIWNQMYDLSVVGAASSEWFHALTEAQQGVGGVGVGDIVVCGVQQTGTGAMDGLIGRVNGNNGTTGAGLQGFGHYGTGTSTEELYSVIELQIVGNQGTIVAVGKTDQPNGPNYDIYAVILPSGATCGSPGPTHLVIDDAGPFSPATDEIARCVRELGNMPSPQGGSLSNMSFGDLVLTGSTTAFGGEDIFLLQVVMSSPPASGIGFYYGDGLNSGTAINRGYSLSEVSTLQDGQGGVIICGLSQDIRCSNTDPQNMELIKTDQVGGVVTCFDDWPTSSSTPGYSETCLTDTRAQPISQTDKSLTPTCKIWECSICQSSGKRAVGGDKTDGAISAIMIQSHPNPVRRGDAITVEVTPVAKTPVVLTVVNVRGETIYTMLLPADGKQSEVSISTEGWASGSYMVKASADDRVDAVKVIVE